MPQLNPEFFVSQLFWLGIFFSFLLIFLWRVSLPRIAIAMEKRQNKIDEDLASAKELQEQAKKIESSINSQITKAKQETEDNIKKTLVSLQDETSSSLLMLDKELDSKVTSSEKEILKNKDLQMKNINNEIVNIAKLTLSKISDLDLSDEEISKIVTSKKGVLN